MHICSIRHPQTIITPSLIVRPWRKTRPWCCDHGRVLRPWCCYRHDVCDQRNPTLCYTAPYSPILNPIEELFSTWKHYFRILMHNQEGSVVSNICACSLRLTQKKIIAYYVHSLEYVIKSLLEEIVD